MPEQFGCEEKWRNLIDRSREIGLSITIDEQLRNHLHKCDACRSYIEFTKKVPPPVDPNELGLKFIRFANQPEDNIDRIIRKRSKFSSLVFIPLLGGVIFFLVSSPILNKKKQMIGKDEILVTKELKAIGVSQVSEHTRYFIFPDDSEVALLDRRFDEDFYSLTKGTTFSVEIENLAKKRYFIMFVVDQQYQVQQLTTGEESIDLLVRPRKTVVKSATLADFIGLGKCLFVGIFSDMPLDKKKLNGVIEKWKKGKYALDGIYSFNRGSWIIITQLIDYERVQ